MGILRQPLFDEAEKRNLMEAVSKMEASAQQAIAKQPKAREMIVQRLNETVREFIRKEVRRKRKESVLFGAVLFVVGMILVWVADTTDSRIVVMLAASFCISGIGTGLLNLFLLLADSTRN